MSGIWVSAALYPPKLPRKGYSGHPQASADTDLFGIASSFQSLSAAAWLFWGLPKWSFLQMSLRLTLTTLLELD